jgi:hypothetical protein
MGYKTVGRGRQEQLYDMLTDLRLYREEKTEITYLNMNTLSCELKDI